MNSVELNILYVDGNTAKTRFVVNKWKFQDSMMGEQFISFTVTSEAPIDWSVGDYCIFRGETFTLNYVPTATQKARTGESQDAYTYENVKFESHREELTRIIMLDITPTTGDYVSALGTNYTGSSKFQLFCGETTANGSTLTAVCALAAKMQANLDRAFQTNGWNVFVDTTSTYVNTRGETVLVTHTEDKVVSFDNTTVAKALEEVHNTFDLDYCVRGRNIYIGYSLKNLTSDIDSETFAFGYGKGYPTRDDSGTGLFQIKRIANSQQKIVTRLRALGSTKNLPYRYYNKKYALSQSLFPTNLQLPDTFEPSSVKETHNTERDTVYGVDPLTHLPYIRHVNGDTNDAYIDKYDDAENCAEGIREESARWDGSNGDLPEIYPTIEEATYGELRAAMVEDQDGHTGSSAFVNYGNNERVDELLAIGYQINGEQIDDANHGDGILPDSGTTGIGTLCSAVVPQTSLTYNTSNYGDFIDKGNYFAGTEKDLFHVPDVSPGRYMMVPTGPSYDSVKYSFNLTCDTGVVSADVGFLMIIKQKSKATGDETTIATYTSDFMPVQTGEIKEFSLPEIPDVKYGNSAQVEEILVTELSDIFVSFVPIMRNIVVSPVFTDSFAFVYLVGFSRIGTTNPYKPEYTWKSLDDDGSQEDIFHVFIKDVGFDIAACWTGETPVVAMKSGRCVGREFEIGENVEKVIYRGKKGYMLTLHRATDSSLNTYYPSSVDPIAPGDNFVLLNINMPDAYIKMAEFRLLRAATDYLADNSETQFTYRPFLDDIYLQRNYDNMVAVGTPQDSIFWRLYAGLKFTFRGIPSDNDDPLPLVDITIEQVTIQMGDGLTPKVDLVLNDNVQQTTLQKLTTSVDRIYNGSLFSNGSGGSGTGATAAALLSILQTDGGKMFISKRNPDTAQEVITFLKGLKVGGGNVYGIDGTGVGELLELITREVRGKSYTGTDLLGDEGFRMWTDEYGKGHIITDYLTTRIRQIVAELEVKRITFTSGNIYLSAANARFTKVVPITEGGRRTYAEILSAGGEVLTGSDEVLTGDSGQPIAPADAYAYRCYWPATDGERRTSNDWRVGDIAWCQTENLTAPGSFTNHQNRQYRRLVVAVGTEIVDGETCHFIDLSAVLSPVVDGTTRIGYDANTPGGNDAPTAGDEVAQVGSQTDDERQGVIALNPVSDNPHIAIYTDVDDYDLPSHRVALLSPAEVNICASYFKLSTAVGTGQTTTPLLNPTVDMWWQNGQNLAVTNSIYVDADAESKIASLSQVQGLPVKIQVRLGNVVIPCSEWTSGTVDGVTIANSSSGIAVTGTGVYVTRAYKNTDSATVVWQYTPIPQLGGQPINPVITSRKVVVSIAFAHDNQAYTVEQEIQMTVQVKGATGAAGQDGTSLNVRGEAILHIESTSDPAPHDEDGTYLIDHDGNGNAGAYIVVVDDGDTYTLATAGYCYKTTDQYHYDASQEGHLWQAQSGGWHDIGPINASDAYSVLPDPAAISMEQNPTGNTWPQPKIGIKAMLGKNTRPYEITAVSSTELQVARTDSNQKVQITGVNQNNGEYYINGTITITVEVDNKEFTVTVSVAMQPVGSWMMTVQNDTLESVSKKYIPFTTDQGGLVTGLGISAFKQSGDGFDFNVWKTVNGTTHTCDAGLSIYITTQTVNNQTVYEGHVEMTGSVHSKNTGTTQNPHYAWLLNEDGSGHVADGAINWSWNNAMQDWQLEVLGTFKGVIKRSKVVVDDSNIAIYAPLSYDDLTQTYVRASLELDQIGSLVYIDDSLDSYIDPVSHEGIDHLDLNLPCLPAQSVPVGVTWEEYRDGVRQFVGCKIVVVNDTTTKNLEFDSIYLDKIVYDDNGRIIVDDGTRIIPPGRVAVFECKMGVAVVNQSSTIVPDNHDKELIYWDVRIAEQCNENESYGAAIRIRP